MIDEVIEIFNEDVFDDVRIGDKEKGLRTLEDTENLSVLLHPFYIFFTFGLLFWFWLIDLKKKIMFWNLIITFFQTPHKLPM